MLRAGIAVLRRSETHRALVHLRLNRPATVAIRHRSSDRTPDQNGQRRAADEVPEEPRQASFDDPLAAIESAEQAKKLERENGRVERLIARHAVKDLRGKKGDHSVPGREPRSDPFENPPPESDEVLDRPRAKLLGQNLEKNKPEAEDPYSSALGNFEQHESGASRTRQSDVRDEDSKVPYLELPKDPAQLKALPTGFHAMTEEEQQEELWIVHAEQHMGREWDLPDPGKHTPYTHDYPPYSPSKVIGMLHRWRNRAWTPRQYRLARAIASNRSLRLPVLTAQAWLRRHTLLARRRGVELKMERYLGSTEGWKMRLAELESQTGVSEADIKQWLWILAPKNGDVKIQRFLNSNCRKPLFLLHLLLAKDKRIQEPATFLGLLQFIRDNYVLADRPRDELDHSAYKAQGRAMTWLHFLVFLYRLVYHCREGWPAAMPLLARLAADYIGTMRLDTNARALTGYQARSLVLNKVLYYLSWPARVRPIDHMEHNWAAQRHLLRLAATAEPPLVMDQNGYRAVRTVLIALSKTKGEAKNADRAAKTWPPYRRTLDGIDERRDPQDDLSRSAKAGMLVRAAGYSDDTVDRAISALGGSTFGQAPTIQTRALPPPFFSGAWASRNIFSEWAAQVRATRNAREAWIVFENPPEPNIRPNAQVYAEMFEKLYARLVTESPVIRPGDVREAFPVYDTNLSEFEIARLTPPSPEELYEHMLLRDNIRPVGFCLVVLIRNAPSRTAALRYLNDSPYQRSIRALREPVWKAGAESLKELSGLPSPVFNAWITLLCRLHERAPREDSASDEPLDESENGDLTASSEGGMTEQERRTREVSRGGSIPEAISLATAFQLHNIKAANHDKAPWHTIMQALAGRKILYSRLGAEFNVLETLMTFLKIYEQTVASKGGDPVSFEALCLMIRKALKLSTFQRSNEGEMVLRPHIVGSDVLQKMLVKAHRYAVRMFAELTEPVAAAEGNDPRDNLLNGPANGAEGENWVSATMLRYNVAGRPIYRYMMALACCGDHTEMVRLMDWILDGWDRDFIREEAKAPHNLDYHYMVRTIAYFAEMGKQLVEPAEMDRLQQRLEDLRGDKGCTWFWPREGLSGPGQDALLELDTDLTLVERWTRLRQMVNFTEPGYPAPSPLSDMSADLEVTLGEQKSNAASSSM